MKKKERRVEEMKYIQKICKEISNVMKKKRVQEKTKDY